MSSKQVAGPVEILKVTRNEVIRSQNPGPWELLNSTLYGFCKKHPDHKDPGHVASKLLLIGRAYAASIERRRKPKGNADSFFLKEAGPLLTDSGLDDWLGEVGHERMKNEDQVNKAADVHGRLVGLLRKITNITNRSFASKYLHFHRPMWFFIQDSITSSEARKIQCQFSGGAISSHVDHEYLRFSLGCFRLTEDIRQKFGMDLTPRQLDNLLVGRQKPR